MVSTRRSLLDYVKKFDEAALQDAHRAPRPPSLSQRPGYELDCEARLAVRRPANGRSMRRLTRLRGAWRDHRPLMALHGASSEETERLIVLSMFRPDRQRIVSAETVPILGRSEHMGCWRRLAHRMSSRGGYAPAFPLIPAEWKDKTHDHQFRSPQGRAQLGRPAAHPRDRQDRPSGRRRRARHARRDRAARHRRLGQDRQAGPGLLPADRQLPGKILRRRQDPGRLLQARRSSDRKRDADLAPDRPSDPPAVPRWLQERDPGRRHRSAARHGEQPGRARHGRGLRRAHHLRRALHGPDRRCPRRL